ncbi:MAG: hypothetical protein ABJH63_02875 [Rhizobiaceae bacterium]
MFSGSDPVNREEEGGVDDVDGALVMQVGEERLFGAGDCEICWSIDTEDGLPKRMISGR